MRGDIDGILLKMLAKNPTERYRSVQEVADDLRRHLANEPVSAVKQTNGYLLGKLLRRQRRFLLGSAVSAALVLAVCSVVVGLWTQAGSAAVGERDANEKALRKAEQAAEYAELAQDSLRALADGVQTSLRDRPGTAVLRAELLSEALAGLQRLTDSYGDTSELQQAKARGMLHLGEVYHSLGRMDDANKSYADSAALLSTLTKKDGTNAQVFADLVVMYWRMGDAALIGNSTDKASTNYQSAQAACQSVQQLSNDPRLYQRLISVTWEKLGNVALSQGRPADARACYAKALEEGPEPDHLSKDHREEAYELSARYERMGDVHLFTLGQPKEAKAFYDKNLEISQTLAAADPENVRYQRSLLIAHEKLGDVAIRTKGGKDALAHYQKALEISKRVAEADSLNTVAQRDLSFSHNRIGDVYRAMRNPVSAEKHYQSAQVIRELILKIDPSNPQAMRDVAFSLTRLGDLAYRGERLTDASTLFEQARQIRMQIVDGDPLNVDNKRSLMASLQRIGDTHRKLGDAGKARDCYLQCKTLVDDILVLDSTNRRAKRDAAVSYGKIGYVLLDAKHLALARKCLKKSVALREGLGGADGGTIQSKVDLTAGYESMGCLANAESNSAEATAWFEKTVAPLKALKEQGREYDRIDADLTRLLGLLDEARRASAATGRQH